MKKKFNKKAFKAAIACGLICAVFLSLADFNASCDDLRENVLRLHIIANSNSAEDQALKLKIRDEILNLSPELFSESGDITSAISNAKKQLEDIEAAANKVIAKNGFEYEAKASVGKSYFGTREYDDFTLPAGEYDSLLIKVGKAEGKNWWCVLYPELCLPAAADKKQLKDAVDDKSAEIAESHDRYIMKFKIVEIYEEIKNSLKK